MPNPIQTTYKKLALDFIQLKYTHQPNLEACLALRDEFIKLHNQATSEKNPDMNAVALSHIKALMQLMLAEPSASPLTEQELVDLSAARGDFNGMGFIRYIHTKRTNQFLDLTNALKSALTLNHMPILENYLLKPQKIEFYHIELTRLTVKTRADYWSTYEPLLNPTQRSQFFNILSNPSFYKPETVQADTEEASKLISQLQEAIHSQESEQIISCFIKHIYPYFNTPRDHTLWVKQLHETFNHIPEFLKHQLTGTTIKIKALTESLKKITPALPILYQKTKKQLTIEKNIHNKLMWLTRLIPADPLSYTAHLPSSKKPYTPLRHESPQPLIQAFDELCANQPINEQKRLSLRDRYVVLYQNPTVKHSQQTLDVLKTLLMGLMQGKLNSQATFNLAAQKADIAGLRFMVSINPKNHFNISNTLASFSNSNTALSAEDCERLWRYFNPQFNEAQKNDFLVTFLHGASYVTKKEHQQALFYLVTHIIPQESLHDTFFENLRLTGAHEALAFLTDHSQHLAPHKPERQRQLKLFLSISHLMLAIQTADNDTFIKLYPKLKDMHPSRRICYDLLQHTLTTLETYRRNKDERKYHSGKLMFDCQFLALLIHSLDVNNTAKLIDLLCYTPNHCFPLDYHQRLFTTFIKDQKTLDARLYAALKVTKQKLEFAYNLDTSILNQAHAVNTNLQTFQFRFDMLFLILFYRAVQNSENSLTELYDLIPAFQPGPLFYLNYLSTYLNSKCQNWLPSETFNNCVFHLTNEMFQLEEVLRYSPNFFITPIDTPSSSRSSSPIPGA